MLWKKIKKKTLTISSSFKRKINTSSLAPAGKKSFSIEKKKQFKSHKSSNRSLGIQNLGKSQDLKKNFPRKFIEQQATKDFIKKTINLQEKVS